ncbi:MAG: MepB family protein [Carnobacterium sp.]
MPSGLRIKVVQEETQNVNYGAGLVDVSSRLARFRVANITAKKIGQFVAFWEKMRVIRIELILMKKLLIF